MDFGDYCHIEQKRFGVPNEMYLHKVIGSLRSNTWVETPVTWERQEVRHEDLEDVLACVCCGVSERQILHYRASDCLPANGVAK